MKLVINKNCNVDNIIIYIFLFFVLYTSSTFWDKKIINMYYKMLTNRKLIIWSSILVLFSFLYGMNYCSRNMTNVNHQNTESDVMCVKPSFDDRTYQPTGKYSTENLIYYGTNKAIALKYNNPKMMRYFTRNGKSDEVRRFPRCIGIGVAKSGTSALKIFLGEHPYMVLTKVNNIY